MISIRSSVFETNSSSSHSICVKTGTPHVDREVITEDIKARLDNTDRWNLSNERTCYGRAPFTVLTTFTEKVLYYVAIKCGYGTTKEDFYDELEPVAEIIREFYPNFNGFTVDHKDERYDYSIGGVDECIFSKYMDKDRIRDFLTNDDMFVVCDGDEYNIFTDMWKFGIINGKEVNY
jgi:hypothetical protein